MHTGQISPEAVFSSLWHFQMTDAQTGHLLLYEPAAQTYRSHEPIRRFPSAGSRCEHTDVQAVQRTRERHCYYNDTKTS